MTERPMAERPTREQIAYWRDLQARAVAGEDHGAAAYAVDVGDLLGILDALTADLTAARAERDEQTRLVDRAYDSLHPQILARAEKAEAALAASEAARETTELALVELVVAASGVMKYPETRPLLGAWATLEGALHTTTTDLADAARRRHQDEIRDAWDEELGALLDAGDGGADLKFPTPPWAGQLWRWMESVQRRYQAEGDEAAKLRAIGRVLWKDCPDDPPMDRILDEIEVRAEAVGEAAAALEELRHAARSAIYSVVAAKVFKDDLDEPAIRALDTAVALTTAELAKRFRSRKSDGGGA